MKINTLNNDINKAYSYYEYTVASPIMNVIVAHGLAEDAIRYEYFAKELNKEGINVFCINHVAHGEDYTNLELGHWEEGDFDVCLSNIEALRKTVTKKYPEIPNVLVGHSMGSFMAQKFELLYPNRFNGHILIGCTKASGLFKLGYIVAKTISLFTKPKKRVSFMNTISFGAFNKFFKPNKTDFDWLSKNVENCINYDNMRTCGYICTSSFYCEFYKNISQIPNEKYDNLFKNNYPILLMGGSDDLVSNKGKGLIELYEYYKKQSNNVSYKIYKDDRHEILNEDDKDIVISDIVNWLKNLL